MSPQSIREHSAALSSGIPLLRARSLFCIAALSAAGCGGGGGDGTTSSPTGDPSATVSVPASALETVGSQTISFELSRPAAENVEIAYTAAGSATPGVDYRLPVSPFVIPAGQTTGQMELIVTDDAVYEGSESIALEFSSSDNAAIASPSFTVELTDAEDRPVASFATVNADLSEGAGTTEIQIALAGESALDMRVTVDVGGDAIEGEDYAFPSNQTVAIPAGETSARLPLQILDDSEVGPSVALELRLRAIENVVVPTDLQPLVLTITDNDGVPSLEFDAVAASAPESGGAATATVRLSSPATEPIQIPISIGGTAGESDFSALPKTITIPAGAVAAELSILALEDTLDEDDESVVVSFTPPMGVAAGPKAEFTLTILDNDEPPSVFVQGSASEVIQVSESQGTHDVFVALAVPSGKDVSVSFSITGTAVAPEDFAEPMGGDFRAMIPAGASSARITLNIVDDHVVENDETLALILLPSPVNATLGANTQANIRIIDNDVDPDIVFISDHNTSSRAALFITDYAGSRVVELANSGNQDVKSFLRSPDGQRIAFVGDRTGTGNERLHVMDARGGEITDVSGVFTTSGGDVKQYAWSPDSQRLAFIARKVNARDELFVAGLGGGEPALISRIVNNGRNVDAFEWEPLVAGAPYNARIAYTADEVTASVLKLYVVTPDGSNRWELSDPSIRLDNSTTLDREAAFHWAPDASRIAFRSRPTGGNWELRTAFPDGSGQHRLSGFFASSSGFVREFKWSPDSQVVAFRANRQTNGRFEIFRATPANTDDAVSLSQETGQRDAKCFEWQPWDAASSAPPMLGYISSKQAGNHFELYVVNHDGTGDTLVSIDLSGTGSGRHVQEDFAWSPDGNLLGYRADSHDSGEFEVFTGNLTGTAKVRVSDFFFPGEEATSFRWSPDSRRLMYIADKNSQGVYELFSAPADTTDSAVQLSSALVSGGDVVEALWTADSSELVYRADATLDGRFELFSTPAIASSPAVVSGSNVDEDGVADGYNVR